MADTGEWAERLTAVIEQGPPRLPPRETAIAGVDVPIATSTWRDLAAVLFVHITGRDLRCSHIWARRVGGGWRFGDEQSDHWPHDPYKRPAFDAAPVVLAGIWTSGDDARTVLVLPGVARERVDSVAVGFGESVAEVLVDRDHGTFIVVVDSAGEPAEISVEARQGERTVDRQVMRVRRYPQ